MANMAKSDWETVTGVTLHNCQRWTERNSHVALFVSHR